MGADPFFRLEEWCFAKSTGRTIVMILQYFDLVSSTMLLDRGLPVQTVVEPSDEGVDSTRLLSYHWRLSNITYNNSFSNISALLRTINIIPLLELSCIDLFFAPVIFEGTRLQMCGRRFYCMARSFYCSCKSIMNRGKLYRAEV